MVPVSFHQFADRELADTAQYYELESPGLGIAFMNEVERCLRSIARHPDAGPAVQGNVRRRLLHGFPYGLLYSVKPSAIRILAVMNLRRRPAYWVGRE